LADYDEAIKIKPDFAEALYNRALLKQLSLHDYPGALSDYDRVIKLKPDLVLAVFNEAC